MKAQLENGIHELSLFDKFTSRSQDSDIAIEENRQRKNTITLAEIPAFQVFHHPHIDSHKEPKAKSVLNKIRNFLQKILSTTAFHVCILLTSLYSLFMGDIRLLAVPPFYDKIFFYVNDAIFFFFLTEFLLILFAERNFIGSFYFYLDIVNLVTLLPETPLIWTPLFRLISGEHTEKINQVLATSHLAKTGLASFAGVKVSNYLRLLHVMNFLQIVRVAKMVEEAEILENKEHNTEISPRKKAGIMTSEAASEKKIDLIEMADMAAGSIKNKQEENEKFNDQLDIGIGIVIQGNPTDDVVHNNIQNVKKEMKKTNSNQGQIVDKKKEVKIIKAYAHKFNSNLEKRLTSRIIHIIVVMVMILLVGMLILNFDFLFPLVFHSQSLDRHTYCMDVIFEFMKMSIEDERYLPGLNKSIYDCFLTPEFAINKTIDGHVESEIPSEMQMFLFIDFSNVMTFRLLQKQRGFMVNQSYVAARDIHEYEASHREEEDYKKGNYTMDAHNTFIYAYDNSQQNRIASIIGIVETVYVASILILMTFIFSRMVHMQVISPLDAIFAKLSLNLYHADVYEKTELVGKLLSSEEINEKEITNDIDLFENSYSYELIQLQRRAKSLSSYLIKTSKLKSKKKKLNMREIGFIDISIKMLLDLISISIGKTAYFLIPHSDLEKKFRLNLKFPSVKFKGIILLLHISQCEDFHSKYHEQSPKILNNLLSLFHSIGTIFNGEPYINNNMAYIIFIQSKQDWIANMKKYSVNLVTKNKNQAEQMIKRIKVERGDKEWEFAELYDKILADLAIICGIRFLYLLQKNLAHTLRLLQSCGVKVNLYMNIGEMTHGFTGGESSLSEIYTGKAIDDVIKIAYTNTLHTTLPSLFLTDAIVSNDIDDVLRKNILPYEYVDMDNKKLIYRHFFDYSIFQPKEDEDNKYQSVVGTHLLGKDLYNPNTLKREKVFKARLAFEQDLIKFKSKDLLIFNYVTSDVSFRTITSKLDSLFKSLIDNAYNYFSSFEYQMCIDGLNEALEKGNEILGSDVVLSAQLREFKKVVMERN